MGTEITAKKCREFAEVVARSRTVGFGHLIDYTQSEQLVDFLHAVAGAIEDAGGSRIASGWPDGLEARTFYEFPCDDKGAGGGSWLRVMIAGDGDVHVSMQDWEDIKTEGTKPSPFPSVRCRSLAGGGRHSRTRKALLWLAQAIRLDSEELGVGEE